MKQHPRCLLVCQAGEGVGLGHLMRSLVAARSIQKTIPNEIFFLIQSEAVDPSVLCGFTFEAISVIEDLGLAIQRIANTFHPNIIMMDLFGPWVPQNFSNTLKVFQGKVKLVAIDSLPGYLQLIDLLFIPSFLQPNLLAENPKQIVFGWDCFLLNVEELQKVKMTDQKVLVLTGGSDSTGLGETLPSLLNLYLPQDTKVEWVTGPYAQTPVWPHNSKIQINNHEAPQGLGSLMREVSFALTVYGVSFYELLYLGVPTVVFSPYGDKNCTELDTIKAEGVALVAYNESHAVELLTELMANPSLATSLINQARLKLQNHGGQRLVREINILLS